MMLQARIAPSAPSNNSSVISFEMGCSSLSESQKILNASVNVRKTRMLKIASDNPSMGSIKLPRILFPESMMCLAWKVFLFTKHP